MSKILDFSIAGQHIEWDTAPTLVAGTVNEYTARFAFNGDWDGYQRVAVFSSDGVEREQLLTDDACTVPWEVLRPGAYLKVGVYGTKDGQRLPTIWTAHRQYIHDGAGPTEEAAAPSPVLAEQMLQRMGDLGQLKTEDKSSLVAAINEVQETGGGGGTSDHSKLKNRDAADQHPMSSITGLADALAGKQPTGNYLTDKDLDATLTVKGKVADAAAVGARLDSLSEEIDTLAVSGLTSTQISALNGMFKVAAYTKADVSAEYSAFKTAFGIEDSGETEPEKTLTSISAVYSGGDVSVGTSLDALTGIIVTATYSDGSTATVTGYTLSGSIAEGVNTITVSYGGKTTTITVTGIDSGDTGELWSYDLNNLVFRKGSIGGNVANEITSNVGSYAANNRRHYIYDSGVKQIIQINTTNAGEESDINNYVESGYYPIPIPETAKKVTYSITPATQYIAISIWSYNENADTYTRTADPGWNQGVGSYKFTAGANQYLTATSKETQAGIGYNVEPTAVSIVFE